jgi:hypothetical protein
MTERPNILSEMNLEDLYKQAGGDGKFGTFENFLDTLKGLSEKLDEHKIAITPGGTARLQRRDSKEETPEN